ncbi:MULTISPECIES: RNA polymerase sigma factor [unclassified Tenacibaculum]|uniref:RNA polymerase sigma factor n=1 Tax=unclassified Tenacibaculum TaxID=2635139 RepID=UPI001F2F0034|nr:MULTISPECIES: sigma-70 family RNA polymerase sigma factor [unclassified Tenacibaculum]MCF2874189.1 sigma-70 family RNA polymerase sigma factor [Tenacibaculum sp. Cn5-1]MCF2934770.1 sigma-70 family RNA polymerase sigma factor [Tenacibaculum sp. Cn5-34]MCG7510980.1 sigma-70 family RNA polymerase sigma factor [Tenacibaculum sp. Cn5-46]
MTINNDQTYIDKVLKGDTNAFSILVEKYKGMIFTLALKMLKSREEAEEISQDTFIKAFKNLDRFKGEAKFSTWLYKIGYRACLDNLKKNKTKYNTDTIDEITINKIKSTEGILEGIERKERAEIINTCIMSLPEDERSILWMFYFEELSLKEIIELTEFSESNVKVKLHRARKRLLTIVEKKVEPELIKHYGRK